ncbi:hypothetical protein BJX64DRAFT_169729 [Aspergillus heterothallicus]
MAACQQRVIQHPREAALVASSELPAFWSQPQQCLASFNLLVLVRDSTAFWPLEEVRSVDDIGLYPFVVCFSRARIQGGLAMALVVEFETFHQMWESLGESDEYHGPRAKDLTEKKTGERIVWKSSLGEHFNCQGQRGCLRWWTPEGGCRIGWNNLPNMDSPSCINQRINQHWNTGARCCLPKCLLPTSNWGLSERRPWPSGTRFT